MSGITSSDWLQSPSYRRKYGLLRRRSLGDLIKVRRKSGASFIWAIGITLTISLVAAWVLFAQGTSSSNEPLPSMPAWQASGLVPGQGLALNHTIVSKEPSIFVIWNAEATGMAPLLLSLQSKFSNRVADATQLILVACGDREQAVRLVRSTGTMQLNHFHLDSMLGENDAPAYTAVEDVALIRYNQYGEEIERIQGLAQVTFALGDL